MPGIYSPLEAKRDPGCYSAIGRNILIMVDGRQDEPGGVARGGTDKPIVD